jgi:hypothetical protein
VLDSVNKCFPSSSPFLKLLYIHVTKKCYQKGTSHTSQFLFQQDCRAPFFSLSFLTNYTSFRILAFTCIAADVPYFALKGRLIKLQYP